MHARNLRNLDASAGSKESFITFSEKTISGTVGNDQDLQQSKGRRNQHPAPFVNFLEKGFEEGKKARMFFDEVNEDGRVDAQRATAQIGHQSHDLRSRSIRSEEHTSELQSQSNLVCRL